MTSQSIEQFIVPGNPPTNVFQFGCTQFGIGPHFCLDGADIGNRATTFHYPESVTLACSDDTVETRIVNSIRAVIEDDIVIPVVDLLLLLPIR